MKFITHPSDLRGIISDTARPQPQKHFESFLEVHGKIPFVQAAEEQTSYDMDDLSEVRPESEEEEFDQCVSW